MTLTELDNKKEFYHEFITPSEDMVRETMLMILWESGWVGWCTPGPSGASQTCWAESPAPAPAAPPSVDQTPCWDHYHYHHYHYHHHHHYHYLLRRSILRLSLALAASLLFFITESGRSRDSEDDDFVLTETPPEAADFTLDLASLLLVSRGLTACVQGWIFCNDMIMKQ